MRTTTVTAAVLSGSAALALAVTHHRRRTPSAAPLDLEQVIDGARRIADGLESGDAIMQGLITYGSTLVDVPKDFGRILAGFGYPRQDTDDWAPLPAAPLREGVGYLHDWLLSGQNPADVLRELRAQAPIRPIADLLGALAFDLDTEDSAREQLAARLRDAELQLRQAAVMVGETDYEEADPQDPHPDDCPGGCAGTGEVNWNDPQADRELCWGRASAPGGDVLAPAVATEPPY